MTHARLTALTLTLTISSLFMQGCGGGGGASGSTTTDSAPAPQTTDSSASSTLSATLNDNRISLDAYVNKLAVVTIPDSLLVESRLFLKLYDDPGAPLFLGEIIPVQNGLLYEYRLEVSLLQGQRQLHYDLFGDSGAVPSVTGEIAL
ncbi:hypothetical protein EUZ85_03480 [Hahella sp. KA22]|uniref:hypothetical protein n=1 Tax=Hahella sp. KA22 TaxID=1628392 RepID=UPI000FDD7929|nr:hypothetical protein [Hahella sp. KA22]AZZ89818.1 hypothetical protein ENC22_00935 [Hahella sp. KA22]QAY53188.1 hypothetical protein EUZ85_03480 [Hahella sp. KA22]